MMECDMLVVLFIKSRAKVPFFIDHFGGGGVGDVTEDMATDSHHPNQQMAALLCRSEKKGKGVITNVLPTHFRRV